MRHFNESRADQTDQRLDTQPVKIQIQNLRRASMFFMASKVVPLEALTGEILSSQRMSQYMAFGGGLGGGMIHIPEDPSLVWNQLDWNYPFAMFVYRDIEKKDDKVSSDLDTRKESVLAKERFVKPASETAQDKKAAEFIGETLEGYMGGGDGLRFGFDNFLWEALDAVGKGVAIGENIFDVASDRIYIRDVRFKPQFLFSFAEGELAPYQSYALPQTGPLRLRADLGFMIEGVDATQPLPDNKFFVHTFRPYQGNRWGSPLIQRVFWLSWFKRAGIKQWLRYLERGAGTVLAKYDSGAAKEEKQIALEAAQAVAEESAAAISKRFEVESLENVRQSLGSAHKELTDEYCNNGIARVILGQTLTSRGSEGGGSRALGEVHERVAARKTETDAKSLMLAVNTQLVFPLTLLNIGPVERPPIWTIKYESGGDLKLMSEILYRAWQMRVPIGKKFYYASLQMPEPEEDEELLEPPAQNEEDEAVPGGESSSFTEGDLVKKKSGSKRSKLPVLKKERFARLRPSMIKSSRQ